MDAKLRVPKKEGSGKCKVELQVRTTMGGKGKGIQGSRIDYHHTIVEISIPKEGGEKAATGIRN